MCDGIVGESTERSPVGSRGQSGGWVRLVAVIRRVIGVVGCLAVAVVVAWFAWVAGRTWQLKQRAENAFLASDWPRAEEALTRWLWYRPQDELALPLAVEVALRLDRHDRAIERLGRWPARSPLAGEARLRRALLLKQAYQVREAERDLIEAARRLPGDPQPPRELVGLYGIERRGHDQRTVLWSLHKAGRRVEALRLLAQSIIVIPPGAIAKTSDEGQILEHGLAVDPDAPDLRAPLARFYRLRGRTSEARRLLENGGTPRSDPAEQLEWLAVQLDEGNSEAVRRWFQQHGPTAAAQPGFEKLRADWLALDGRPRDAAEAYERAMRLDPRDLEVPYRLGEALRAAGDPTAARAALDRHRALTEYATAAAAVDENAPGVASLLKAGRAAAVLGPARRDEARAWFAEVLRLEPTNSDARAEMARLGDAPGKTGGGVP